MKNQFVNALQEGDYVNDYFVATRKDLRPKQSGGKFLGMNRLFPSPVFRDMNGDGQLDIVVGDLRGRMTVALGQGKLQFGAETELKALDGQPENTDFLCLRLQTAHAKGLPLKAHWERFRQLLVVDALHVRGHLLMLDNLKA